MENDKIQNIRKEGQQNIQKSNLYQCAQTGHANYAHTITGYIRANEVGAVSLVARATDFSSSEFKNSEMLENLRETLALSLFRLYIMIYI